MRLLHLEEGLDSFIFQTRPAAPNSDIWQNSRWKVPHKGQDGSRKVHSNKHKLIFQSSRIATCPALKRPTWSECSSCKLKCNIVINCQFQFESVLSFEITTWRNVAWCHNLTLDHTAHHHHYHLQYGRHSRKMRSFFTGGLIQSDTSLEKQKFDWQTDSA